MEIRAEKPQDFAAIRAVNTAAFGRENEANLVDQLRLATSILSFVAVQEKQLVGHILFSPVSVQGKCPKDLLILGLAPMAVLPEYQRQRIGSRLIKHSLKACSEYGCKALVVLGHPEYYPYFGFVPAKEKGFKCEYTVPDEAFMILELQSGILDGCSGTVKYRPEFMNV
jgi:putative acetyltransferase